MPPTAKPTPLRRSRSSPSREKNESSSELRAGATGAGRVTLVSCATATRGTTTTAPTTTSAASIAAARSRSVGLRERGPRIVGLEDGAVVLAGARPPDRAPLAHPDSMSVPAAGDRELRQAAVPPHRRLESKIRAVQDLATARPEHEPR